MATASRVFWETVIFLSFLAILIGALFWGGRRVERRAADLSKQHEESLRVDAERHQTEIESLQQDWSERLSDQAKNEAEAVLVAFEAGAHTAIAARWGRYLQTATDELTDQPRVLFLHIVTPQGRVITSSDDELIASGRLQEDDQWALAAEGLKSRGGSKSGTLELSKPVRENGRTVAFIWMGYELGDASGSPAG